MPWTTSTFRSFDGEVEPAQVAFERRAGGERVGDGEVGHS